jgi:hypothetical protein
MEYIGITGDWLGRSPGAALEPASYLTDVRFISL